MPDGGVLDAHSIAEQAGLQYLDDDRPGLHRRRRGKGFSYVDEDGRQVSVAERKRIGALVIPPAWEDVWISPEADAHLLVTGLDDAGRKQYLYHPEWRRAADEVKFERLPAFAEALGALRPRIEHDLGGDGIDRICAAALRLVDECLIRPGSRRHLRRHESVGATTLRGADVEVGRRTIVLEFSGKGGVDHHIELRDPALARVLGQLIDTAGDDGLVFTTSDGQCVDERRLNQYIEVHSGGGFTAKDFRTWGATAIVAGELAGRDVDAGSNDDAIRAAIQLAADALANTPAVCRASYVAPSILDAFESGTLAAAWRVTRAGKWLSRAERTTHRVLAPAGGL